METHVLPTSGEGPETVSETIPSDLFRRCPSLSAPNVPCFLVMVVVLIHLIGYSYSTSVGTAGQVIHVSPPDVENRVKKIS